MRPPEDAAFRLRNGPKYIEKMVSIVPYQFKPESDDETVEVSDR